MTDSSLRCDGCDRRLDSEDMFCSKCGHPTSINVNAQATIIDEPPAQTPSASRDSRPASRNSGTAPLSNVTFTERVRHVLGDEFEILALIGTGSFARVYRALDRRLDRMVAIKIIQPELAGNETFVNTFRNEGVALAKLRHPGIVPIYDIRELGGLIYHVMPFVKGTTLDRRLERSRLPPFESRRILSELTDALDAAHQAKMVHLDIKPENIFLEGDHQKPLLLDFGVAVALADMVPESGGPIAGTPAYMSPEQARGLPDLDHRSDIYSLGALGYRMIMGRPPYVATTIEEVRRKHEEESPVHIREINPSIPKDFADAIMRCLEKDPWKRFATAREVGGVLNSVSFSTQRDTKPEQEPSRTSVTLVVLVAILALVVGLIVGRAIG